MLLDRRNPLQQPSDRPEIEYPCTWSYRVIGADCSLMKDVILAACSPLPVQINHSHSSSKGKYHSLNAVLEVPSEEVRLKIYKALQCSPAIKIIL